MPRATNVYFIGHYDLTVLRKGAVKIYLINSNSHWEINDISCLEPLHAVLLRNVYIKLLYFQMKNYWLTQI